MLALGEHYHVVVKSALQEKLRKKAITRNQDLPRTYVWGFVMNKSYLQSAVYGCLICLTAVAYNAHAAIIDFTSSITINPDNIVQTSSDGVIVTAYGYHAEFPSTTSTVTNVYGPFPTTTGDRSLTIFGNNYRLNGGLGLLAQPTGSLTPTENDVGTALFQPTFDNAARASGALPNIQFALFTFSAPVDVSQVIVNTSNGTGDLFYAGASGAVPDLFTDFLGTLATLGVQTSIDNMGGIQFTHNLTGLTNLDFLLVGTPPRDDPYGPLTAEGSAGFYIDALNLAPTAIPLPPAVWLFGAGLLGLISVARRKKTN